MIFVCSRITARFILRFFEVWMCEFCLYHYFTSLEYFSIVVWQNDNLGSRSKFSFCSTARLDWVENDCLKNVGCVGAGSFCHHLSFFCLCLVWFYIFLRLPQINDSHCLITIAGFAMHYIDIIWISIFFFYESVVSIQHFWLLLVQNGLSQGSWMCSLTVCERKTSGVCFVYPEQL